MARRNSWNVVGEGAIVGLTLGQIAGSRSSPWCNSRRSTYRRTRLDCAAAAAGGTFSAQPSAISKRAD